MSKVIFNLAVLVLVLAIAASSFCEIRESPLKNLLEVKDYDTNLPNYLFNNEKKIQMDFPDFENQLDTLQQFIFCFNKETIIHKNLLEKYLQSSFGSQLGQGCSIINAPTKKMQFLLIQMQNKAEKKPTSFSFSSLSSVAAADKFISSLVEENLHIGLYRPEHKFRIEKFEKAVKILKKYKNENPISQHFAKQDGVLEKVNVVPFGAQIPQKNVSPKKMFTNALEIFLNPAVKKSKDVLDMPFVITTLKEKSTFTGKIQSSNFDSLSLEMKIGSVLRGNGLKQEDEFKIISTSEKVFISFYNYDHSDEKATKKLLGKVALQLAAFHEVHWIEPHFFSSVQNYYSRHITQGFGASANPNTESLLSTAGLTGKGQTVAIADSGLDTKSCFFADSDPKNNNFFVRTDIKATETYTALENNNHRKIKGYWGLIDEQCDDGAHGTHVSGTVAGKALFTPKNLLPSFDLRSYNGMAQDSKILFTDVGCSTPGGCQCYKDVPCECEFFYGNKCPESGSYVFVPLSLKDSLFPFSKKANSFIHTNSWGGGTSMGYSIYSMEIDSFAWENKDFLILFAAGNAADQLLFESLGSQAESKNVLTVGATSNTLESFKFAAESVMDYDARAKAIAQAVYDYIGCPTILPAIEAMVDSKSTLNSKYLNFKEECEFWSKNFTTEADCCSQTTKFCSGSLACGCGKLNIGEYCCRKCFRATFDDPFSGEEYNEENLAFFSSLGPTSDYRIKPDVVAPGHSLLSARSYHSLKNPRTCPADDDLTVKPDQLLLSMGGTSMATPVVAGNAAIVRQYFVDGWYPTGYPGESKSITPSAALMKNIIISSGTPLSGNFEIQGTLFLIHPEFTNLDPSQVDEQIYFNPKSMEGYGKMNLLNVLQINERLNPSKAGNQDFKLNVPLDEVNGQKKDFIIEKTGESKAFKTSLKLGAQRTRNVLCKFTLAYTDYPASPAAATKLVNDLNLVVKMNSEYYYYGNQKTMKTSKDKTRYFGPFDHKNNVEQVALSFDTKAGVNQEFEVLILGDMIAVGPQPFSLTVLCGATERSNETKSPVSVEALSTSFVPSTGLTNPADEFFGVSETSILDNKYVIPALVIIELIVVYTVILVCGACVSVMSFGWCLFCFTVIALALVTSGCACFNCCCMTLCCATRKRGKQITKQDKQFAFKLEDHEFQFELDRTNPSNDDDETAKKNQKKPEKKDEVKMAVGNMSINGEDDDDDDLVDEVDIHENSNEMMEDVSQN